MCLCAQHVYILGIMTCTHQMQAAHESDKRMTWGGGKIEQWVVFRAAGNAGSKGSSGRNAWKYTYELQKLVQMVVCLGIYVRAAKAGSKDSSGRNAWEYMYELQKLVRKVAVGGILGNVRAAGNAGSKGSSGRNAWEFTYELQKLV